jgi:hypothetical protein
MTSILIIAIVSANFRARLSVRQLTGHHHPRLSFPRSQLARHPALCGAFGILYE